MDRAAPGEAQQPENTGGGSEDPSTFQNFLAE